MHDIRHHRISVNVLTAVALAVALLLSAAQVRAISGQPDPTFGQDGRVRLGIHGGYDWANATAQQADGRIVVAGTGRNGGWAAGPLLLARYNTDGSTDTSFGDGGAAWYFSDADTTYEPSAVAVQTDGKIVVMGNAVGGDIIYSVYRLYVARFEANGSPDTTFGNGGILYPYQSYFRFWGGAMLIQADGRIVIAGGIGSSSRLAITRLNSNGAVDATFNGYGYNAATVLDYSGANAIGLLNGKYVVAGTAYDASNHSYILTAQFNDNGTLNTAFGGSGVVTTAVGTRASGYALAFETSIVQPTKIIVAGESDNQFALVRYLPDGTLDAAFDGDGAKVIAAGAYDSGAVAVRILYTSQVATRIVVAGFSQAGSGNATKEFAVAKLMIGGPLDTTFDGDGIARTTLGTDGATPCAMLASGSRLTLIGTAGGSYTASNVAMARYVVSSGALDTAFDGDGKRTDDLGLTASSARDVAVQGDGGIVVAGSLTRHGGPERAVVARFLPNGTPDAGFDADGLLEIDNGTGDCKANAVLVDPDGRIVIGGYGVPAPAISYPKHFFLSRREPDGSPDPTFGSNGIVLATGLPAIEVTALLRQSDGKLVAVGSLHDFNYYCFAAVRFEANGTIDTSFGPDGDGSCTISAHTNVYGGSPEPAAVLQSDDSILIVGERGGNLATRDACLVRLTPDGLLDVSFGANGSVQTAIGSSRDMARGVAVRPDGRIVVAGWAETGAVTKAFVIRYMPDGTVDPSFGVGGHVLLDLGDPASACAAMALELQSDGTIVIAGHGAQGGDVDFAIARLTPHGAVDTSFGSSGQALVGFPGAGEDIAAALAFDAQGNAILAGESLGNIAVARVLNGPDASAVIQAPAGSGGLFLSAPSPNPTTSGATLALELKADTRTSASVYDVAGRVVRRLFGDRALEAGRHMLGWDGRDDAGRPVAAGVYYLRLAAPGGDATRKVVVVR